LGAREEPFSSPKRPNPHLPIVRRHCVWTPGLPAGDALQHSLLHCHPRSSPCRTYPATPSTRSCWLAFFTGSRRAPRCRSARLENFHQAEWPDFSASPNAAPGAQGPAPFRADRALGKPLDLMRNPARSPQSTPRFASHREKVMPAGAPQLLHPDSHNFLWPHPPTRVDP